MKCQFCHKNEADRIFYVDHMNTEYQFSVCESCLQKMWQQSLASGYTEAFQNYSGWWPGQPEPRKFGEKVFPEEADTELKKKRQLSILKIQLKEAAAQERYEEAAQLRDHIARMEKEVCAYEG